MNLLLKLVTILFTITAIILIIVFCFNKDLFNDEKKLLKEPNYDFNKDLFNGEKKLLKAPNCTHAGLGDRIGEYIIFSTLGKVYNVNILVFWSRDKISDASRPDDYPENIHDYIMFPKNLIFVTKKEFKKTKIKKVCNERFSWKDYYFGDEFIPEIVYKKLNLDKHINLNDYIKLYKETAKEVKYLKSLPKLPTNFTAIHIRRGDKKTEPGVKKSILFHDNRLIDVFNKLHIDDYILCSEDNNPIKSKLPLNIKLSNDKKIKTLEEFFILSNANIIIQSVPGDERYSGWSSYSYVASRIGDSVLYNCSPEGTRLYYMENTAGRKLYNVIKYSDINPRYKI